MADAADLKSASRKGVWVRVPPSAVSLTPQKFKEQRSQIEDKKSVSFFCIFIASCKSLSNSLSSARELMPHKIFDLTRCERENFTFTLRQAQGRLLIVLRELLEGQDNLTPTKVYSERY